MTDTTADPFAMPTEESEPPPAPKPATGSAISIPKLVMIAGLAFATILPNLMISGVIEERQQREYSVRDEITRNWGPQQSLYTPTLMIPYQAGDRPREYVKLAPARLDLNADLAPQERKRGLFHATVYDTKLTMDGIFVIPPETRLRDFVTDKDGRFFWSEAQVVFGSAAALTGLRASDNIAIDGTATQWQPCMEALRAEKACDGATLVLANAPLTSSATNTRIAFKSVVSLRGSSSLCLRFPGKELNATITSSWPTPSFSGNTLPLNSTVTAEGFKADWQTMEFGSPRVTVGPTMLDAPMWSGPTIGVDLIEATPIYRMINRVAKYGLLFVILSFATYFFFEVLSRLRIHIVQYALLGLSLSLFSLLLLSLAEPIGYINGYLVAAGLVLAQSTLYTLAVARRFTPAFLFALMLSCLFGLIYVLLGLETYSLLIGAFALFVVVSALMVLTQMVKWPERLQPSSAAA